MKTNRFFLVALILIGILLSACAAAPATPSAAPASAGGDKALFSEVVFTGVIDGMDGDQWVINGQPVKVDPSVLRDGPFVVGDTVKVEALVAQDGSVTAQRVESPTAADLTQAVSTPAVSSTQVPLTFDDSGTEAFGTVESITDTSITISGQTFPFAPGAEIKGVIAAGAVVKLHFIVNADGTLSVREVELASPTQIGSDDNGNDDNSNANANDDNSNDDNGNDDSSNDNGNDDDSNDDNGNDDDSNEDNGGNSNDDDDDDNSNDSNDNG